MLERFYFLRTRQRKLTKPGHSKITECPSLNAFGTESCSESASRGVSGEALARSTFGEVDRVFLIVLVIMAVDAIGAGLVMPILPALLRQIGQTEYIAVFFGVLMAAYAAMQFLFSPFLGLLSDRYGRRPVLLVSLAGAAVDYLVTAAAPSLAILVAGSVLAGITGASGVTVTSVLVDVTGTENRATQFGRLSAVAGIGLIAGPVLGGLLGTVSLRAPFLLAAGLNAASAAIVLWLLPETIPATAARPKLLLRSVLPSFAALRLHPDAARLVGIFIMLVVAAQVPASLWVLYGENRFGMSKLVIGLFLTVYSLLNAGAQFLLVAPMIRHIGEWGCLVLGAISSCVACAVLSVAAQGWVAFALVPLWCLGGLALPALQSMLSRTTMAEQQGRLQGALVSLGSLVGIPGPLLVTVVFNQSSARFPGLVWLLAAAAYLSVPVILLSRRGDSARGQARCSR